MKKNRVMASTEKVLDIKPIEGADLICAYKIKGWWVVDKVNAHKVGDTVVYLEVDSWVPTELAPFLSKGKEPSVYKQVKGERLRTQKFKNQISQGLILKLQGEGQSGTALHITKPDGSLHYISGLHEDVTEVLGVQKWEPTLPACLAGDAKGLFPSCIPKTDQERIQNMQFEDLLEGKYEITEKLHGSSMTVLLDSDGNFEVCSRNLSLKEQEHNAYWMVANKYNLKQKMIEHGFLGYAIQGELCGAGINGNQYNLDLDLFVFDVLKEQDSVYTYLSANERTELCAKLGLKHVPVLGHRSIAEVGYDTESLLLNAEGKSMLNGSEREGLVFKHLSNPEYSFKVISTKWLIKNKE